MLEWHVPGWPTDIAVVLRSKDRKRTDPSCLPYQRSALSAVSEESNHIPRLLFPRQSIPNVDWPSFTCRLLTSVKVSIGDSPLFSARSRGIDQVQSRRERAHGVLFYRRDLHVTVKSSSGKKCTKVSTHLIGSFRHGDRGADFCSSSTVNTRLCLMRLRTAHMESWSARFASSTI